MLIKNETKFLNLNFQKVKLAKQTYTSQEHVTIEHLHLAERTAPAAYEFENGVDSNILKIHEASVRQ